MNKNKSRQASMLLVGAGLFVVAVIVLALIFSGVLNIVQPPTETPTNPPKPTIDHQSINGGEYLEDGNYVYKVFATVRNEGGDGWIKVYAKLTRYSQTRQQDQRLFLANLEERTVQFKFATIYGNFTTYETYNLYVWAEPD